MSHFTKCALKVTNLVALKRALAEMGLTFSEAEVGQHVYVRGYKGAKENADVVVNMGKYDIGFVKQEDGTYQMVADWWGIEVTGHGTQEEFEEKVNQQYAYQRVVIACEEQGYTMEETKTEETGTISVTLKKWA